MLRQTRGGNTLVSAGTHQKLRDRLWVGSQSSTLDGCLCFWRSIQSIYPELLRASTETESQTL